MSKGFNLNKIYAGNDPIFRMGKSKLVQKFAESAEELDLKVATLDDMLDKFLIKYKQDPNLMKELVNEIEDGHAGHILLTNLQWKLIKNEGQ